MIALIVIPLCLLGIVALVGLALHAHERNQILQLLTLGFGVRLLLFEAVMRRVAFFTHGVAGGDCLAYQDYGSMIAMLWRFGTVHFVTESEMPPIHEAALPCNALALLEYANGEPAPLAGTALNAFLACWTVLLIYKFMRDAGTPADAARWVSVLVLFGPSFLYHTSDTYKDGVNSFLVIASLLNALRLSQRFAPERLAYFAISLGLLWFVRRYMVFMCLAPLSIGILGIGKASVPRRIAAALFLFAAAVGVFATGAGGQVVTTVRDTYAHATDANVLAWNARNGRAEVQGSGVVTSSYLEALLYTIAAPFPWQFGSIGFQLGKLEAFILYWFGYVIYRNRSTLWSAHRATTIMLGVFIVPSTLAYAATMANVGLIVRQRMPIVLALAVLAGLAYRRDTRRALVRPQGTQRPVSAAE